MKHKTGRILGVKTDLVGYCEVIEIINSWIKDNCKGKFIVQENVFTVMNAIDNDNYKNVIEHAALVVPDGLPIVWVNNLKGAKLKENIRGAELMLRCLEQSVDKGIRHFFYGGKEGTPEGLKERMEAKFPGIQIAGTYSPPFRKMTGEEDKSVCEMINNSRADVLWVGLGAPKQDIWMYKHKDKLNVKAMIGVGAAFDFHTGRIKQAPLWMQNMGLEWLFRLSQEPRRLAKRYLYNNPRFIFYVLLEMMGIRKFVFILAVAGTLFFSSSHLGYCKNIRSFNDGLWQNNSQWADVKVDACQEGVVEGIGKVYKIECESFKGGAVQFVRFVNDFPLKRNIPYQVEIWLKGEVKSPVEVQLRQRGAPYKTYISRSFMLGSEWKKYSYVTFAPENIDEYYFMVRFLDRGTVYVGDAKLEEADDSQKEIDDNVTNLIDNGSFEVGLDRWGVLLRESSYYHEMPIRASNVRPTTVTRGKGSGKRSLQLSIPEHASIALTSGYFSVPQSGEYILSCYLRANTLNPMHVSLGISPYYFGQGDYTVQDFSVGRKWKKYLIKTRLYAFEGARYFVKLESKDPGVLWVDSVQLSQKDTANFVPAKAAEAGFERRESNIFRLGEEIELLLDIYAYKPASVELQLSSTDFWGSKSVLYNQPLDLKAGEFRQVKISHPSLKTGYYRIEAELKSPKESVDVAETAIGVVPFIQSGELVKSPFGGHVYFNKNRLREANVLGVKWLRMHPPQGTKWFIVEKEKGKFVYPDKEIKLAKDMGFAILGSLDTTPRWASSAPEEMKADSHDGYRSFMPQNIEDWKKYVANTVLHYKGIIDHWEIWNEPDSGFFHSSGGESQKAKDYVVLLKAGYEAAKSVNPQCVIVGGVGCKQPFDKWLEAIVREGALDYLDVISFHGYIKDETAFGDESVMRKRVEEIKEVIKKYGKGKVIPVWDTESGVAFTKSSYTNIKEVFPEYPMSGTDGPGYFVRRMVNLLASGVDKWFYYSLFASNRSDRKECMGFFEWDNAPRPLAIAYAVMAALIGDKQFEKERVMGGAIYCAEFKGKNSESLKILWSENGEAVIDFDVENVSSAKVIDIMGNEVKKNLSGKDKIKLMISSNPLYVVE